MALFRIRNTDVVVKILHAFGYVTDLSNVTDIEFLLLYTGSKMYTKFVNGSIDRIEITEDELAALLLVNHAVHKLFIRGLRHDC